MTSKAKVGRPSFRKNEQRLGTMIKGQQVDGYHHQQQSIENRMAERKAFHQKDVACAPEQLAPWDKNGGGGPFHEIPDPTPSEIREKPTAFDKLSNNVPVANPSLLQPGAYLVQGNNTQNALLLRGSAVSNDDTTCTATLWKSPPPNEEVVISAQLVSEDAEAEIENLVREKILSNAAIASIVSKEPSCKNLGKGTDDSHHHTNNHKQENSYKPRRRNVREKLFGDPRRTLKDQDISAAPDRCIRKRNFLPFQLSQNHNAPTHPWAVSVQTNQKAAESTIQNELELERSERVFAASTQLEAKEVALTVAVPRMDSFQDNPVCYLCKSKFAVFRRPSHCRNCGVVVCASCSTCWHAKMLPETYNIVRKESLPNICLACDWLARNFQQALLSGNYKMVVNLYKTGNVNVRTPYCLEKRLEVLYPIHMAILGGNVKLVRWLASDRCCPLTTTTTTTTSRTTTTSITRIQQQQSGHIRNNSSSHRDDRKTAGSSSRLLTSNGRSPLQLALRHLNILRYLVSEKNLNLLDEPDLDYKVILTHLSSLLQTTTTTTAATPDEQQSDFKTTILDWSAVHPSLFPQEHNLMAQSSNPSSSVRSFDEQQEPLVISTTLTTASPEDEEKSSRTSNRVSF